MYPKILSLTVALTALCGASRGQCEVIELQKILNPVPAVEDRFGSSVSVDGDVALIGAPLDDYGGHDNSGSVYVFRYDDSTWAYEQKIYSSRPASGRTLGRSVSVSGDVAVVGAPTLEAGSAEVYRFDGISWVLEAVLEPSDGSWGDEFGIAVSIDTNWIIVGAGLADPHGDSSGAAYMFWYDGTGWAEQTKLMPSDAGPGDLFGRLSVAIDDNLALVGAHGKWDVQGVAYVFRYSRGAWREEQRLEASDGARRDWFGNAVEIQKDHVTGQDIALVGAYYSILGGSAYVFQHGSTGWRQQQKLKASDHDPGDLFGKSVDLDGALAVVGAMHDEGGGSAYVFERDFHGTWHETMKLAPGPGDGGDDFDLLGDSVAVDWPFVLAGASASDDPLKGSGAVHVYPAQPDLSLLASPRDPAAGDLVLLITSFGYPGDPVGLALVELDGVPTFQFVAIGVFRTPSCKWGIAGVVPPGLAGVVARFQSFGVTVCGSIDKSNLEVIRFR